MAFANQYKYNVDAGGTEIIQTGPCSVIRCIESTKPFQVRPDNQGQYVTIQKGLGFRYSDTFSVVYLTNTSTESNAITLLIGTAEVDDNRLSITGITGALDTNISGVSTGVVVPVTFSGGSSTEHVIVDSGSITIDNTSGFDVTLTGTQATVPVKNDATSALAVEAKVTNPTTGTNPVVKTPLVVDTDSSVVKIKNDTDAQNNTIDIDVTWGSAHPVSVNGDVAVVNSGTPGKGNLDVNVTNAVSLSGLELSSAGALTINTNNKTLTIAGNANVTSEINSTSMSFTSTNNHQIFMQNTNSTNAVKITTTDSSSANYIVLFPQQSIVLDGIKGTLYAWAIGDTTAIISYGYIR